MKILIVEGNVKRTRLEREKSGIIPYNLLFIKMLKILNPTILPDVVCPADDDKFLPNKEELLKYDGIMWTGSALCIMDKIPEVIRQLEFAQVIFESGVPLYGSCWGMQVATVVAGGKVAQSPIGLEIGISQPIKLTEEGKKSPFFTQREDDFKALCIHFDEVVEAPKNSKILASNNHSKIQAITFKYRKSHFFGVQYHPEFSTNIMVNIISFLSDKFVAVNAFPSMNEVKKLNDKLNNKNKLPQEISNYLKHTQEIMSWLNYISKCKRN
ncbi:MAG: type 1 glutamine amidotransferase [Flavobacteriaceae bacterium]|nr:type 1 glutamine amidotransferase [Flavobacteriaceae bacterium]